MKFNLVSAILLCLATWMTLVHATHGPVATCCPRWSNTTAPLKKIVNYTNQSEGICPVAAVIFYTETGRRICSNPTSKWAMKAILKVDEDKNKKTVQEAGQNEDISRIDITPAAAIASKNPQQKTSRKGRRRQRRRQKCRELRNWQRRRN